MTVVPVVVPISATGVTSKKMYLPVSGLVNLYVLPTSPGITTLSDPSDFVPRYHLKVDVPSSLPSKSEYSYDPVNMFPS